MKHRLIMTYVTIVVGCAIPVRAQLGRLTVAPDPAGAECNIVDAVPGLIKIWIVHTLGTNVAGSQFSAPKPSCMVDATWLSDGDLAGAFIGDTQTGLSIGYGVCSNSPVAVVSMSFFAQGTTPACCCYFIYPHPGNPLNRIEFTDCVPTEHEGYAYHGFVNADWTSCGCFVGDGSGGCANEPVPVEGTTWGALKAMYAN